MISDALDEICSHYPGTVSFFSSNLATGESLMREPDRPMRTASVIKVPILVEAVWQVHEEKLSWSDPLRLDHASAVGGSGILNELSDGLTLTLRDCVYLMIALSDNTATNMTLDAVGGAAAVNTRMQSLGLPLTTVFRKAFSPNDPNDPIGQRFGLGRTTAREMADLLTMLARGEVMSHDASHLAIDFLKKQQDNTGIARLLPEGMQTATKSGAVESLRNDVGLVFPPEGKGLLALAIFCDGQPASSAYRPDDIGLWTIAQVAKSLVSALTGTDISE